MEYQQLQIGRIVKISDTATPTKTRGKIGTVTHLWPENETPHAFVKFPKPHILPDGREVDGYPYNADELELNPQSELDNTPLTESERVTALGKYAAQLERERDAMHAEYEATFGELHEEISQWREVMRQIEITALSGRSAIKPYETLNWIAEKAQAIQARYLIRLDGDGDAPETDEQS